MLIEALTFEQALKRAQALTGDAAKTAFGAPQTEPHKLLCEAMLYALEGGKALRAFLVIESARLHGQSLEAATQAALAVECIHAYSLIHDDLPCMDDDDLRRGKPTVHRKWNEHTAVLAGDALQAKAFELLATPDVGAHALELVRQLAVASGHEGMVGGQMMDIAAETSETPLTIEQIKAVQHGKTGALINWSAKAGAVMSGASSAGLETYGRALGLAFQIADDILDVEGDVSETGKAVGKDADAGKATFVSLLGLDAAKRQAADLVEQGCEALSVYGSDADCLREAARFVISRRK
ncbi:polyprenyl synthetase family protein [Lentibacter algarum]|uniref:polyprenyl synthetase family protein n=1 Tax=Lentibacter algarum TaxID=576131 RepID=UPI001C06FAD7|nr:farnesyl diphosphate synthase [Lentibacter algarum]MBU2981103.1 polyprenyl synthetase family protein [Lentibacter algarum]